MAYDPTIPALENYIGDDIAKIRENFAELAGSRIVEMGSNANGEYVRWENGLQVCWTNVSETVNITSSSALGGYFGNGTARSFPAAFAARPVVLVTQDEGAFAEALNVLVTGYTVRYRSISSVSNWSNSVYVFAIGRWK